MTIVLPWAGCLGGSPSTPSDADGPDGDGVMLRGLVVDTEFFPLDEAAVTLAGSDETTVTDGNGTFELGPVAVGSAFTLVVEKMGYLDQEVAGQAAADDRQILVTLTPTALDVPFHETFVHVALLDCSWAILSATFPCVPIDRVTGQNITGDRSEWNFEIPYDGLADLLHEMTWQEQATGKDMKIVMTDPGEAVFVGGVSNFYLSRAGGDPLRSWLVPGQVGPGGDVPFDGNESREYRAFIRGSESNMTVPVAAIYIEHRADNWFSFFYNRAGPRDFTALPDE